MNRAYTLHRPVANEYLVRERDRRSRRQLLQVLLVLAPVALALTAFTWVHLQVLDAGYRIEELEGRRHDLGRRESRLRLEAAYLASPNLIERRARAELAMRPPELEELVFVSSEKEGRKAESLPEEPGRDGAPLPEHAGREGASLPENEGREGAFVQEQEGREGAWLPEQEGREGAPIQEHEGREEASLAPLGGRGNEGEGGNRQTEGGDRRTEGGRP